MKQISVPQSKKSLGIFVLLLSIFTAMAVAAGAQKNYNVTVISPTSGMALIKGQKYNLEFKVTNTGMTPIAAMDTIMVDVSVNGTSAFMGGTILMSPIAMGSYQTFQIKDFSYSGFSTNSDNGNLCMKVMIPRNTNSGNGQACQTVKLRLSPAAVGQQVSASFVSVYPNPAGAFIKIKASVEGSVSLFDLSGRQISQVAVNGAEQTIETGNYPSGIYFYRLSDKQGAVLQTGKVTISH